MNVSSGFYLSREHICLVDRADIRFEILLYQKKNKKRIVTIEKEKTYYLFGIKK